MNMEDKVLSIEQMQELIDMGIDVSNASIYWLVNTRNARGKKEDLIPPFLSLHPTTQVVGLMHFDAIPTFILQDILGILPKYFGDCALDINYNECQIQYIDIKGIALFEGFWFENDNIHSLLISAFNTLKYCKQNNYI